MSESEDAATTTQSHVPLPPMLRTEPARTAIGRWMRAGHTGREEAEPTHSWPSVLWLTGVDYFSTLGYQPGIALLAAGSLSPVATAILVVVTLVGAVPVYAQVAKRSYAGEGSIAMLESLLSGWRGKLLVLGLLGFAATDFVITMTLSAADAAQHAVENPVLEPYVGHARLGLTLALLAFLAAVFLKGFREAIGVAKAVAVPYLLLNVVVLVRGLVEIALRPETLDAWRRALEPHGSWTSILLVSAVVFPKLALGLSGFETGVSVMPLVEGAPDDARTPTPLGRIRATRKLLVSAAAVMSVMLVLSSFVTTLLVPPDAYAADGPAAGRAISYLAHELLGHGFGTLYDLWTIAILWFAGASAMAGLLNLVPRYLPRFGMAPQWTAYRRPLVLVLFAVAAFVTWAFDADVEKQGGAYATGVLVLMLSAAFAVALACWREARQGSSIAARFGLRGQSAYFWAVVLVFAFTLVDNVLERPDGVVIAAAFIGSILAVGAASRFRRATELRVAEVRFADARSAELWRSLVGRKVNLIPLGSDSPERRETKVQEIRRHYVIDGPLAFLHVRLADNRSEFLAPLRVRIEPLGTDFVVTVSGAIAVANTIACISELIDPLRIFLALTRKNLMTQALRYVLWGEGEIGIKVYEILLRYWEWTREENVRPLIFLMSE
jgi:hypothetical protein